MATLSGKFPKTTGDKIYAQDIEQLRRIPQYSTGTYTLSPLQVGQHVTVNGTISVPTPLSGMQAGDAVTIYNPGSVSVSIAASAGSNPAIYKLAGTTVVPTLLAANGLVTFLCVNSGGVSSSPVYVVIGGGVS